MDLKATESCKQEAAEATFRGRRIANEKCSISCSYAALPCFSFLSPSRFREKGVARLNYLRRKNKTDERGSLASAPKTETFQG
jgi:hypothetical protein